MSELFKYTGGTKPENGVRLSGSGLATLVDNPAVGAKNILVGSDFTGNTATRLGTIFHALAENHYLQAHTVASIKEQAIQWLESQEEPDMWRIIENVFPMYESWTKGFGNKQKPTDVELYVEWNPTERISLNGSIDFIGNVNGVKTLLDHKTTAKKKSSLGDYWLQVYFYAWVYNQTHEGDPIKQVGVCYQQEPLKSGVPDPLVVMETIDPERMEMLQQRVKQEADLLLKCVDDEALIDVYYRNNFLSFRKG